MNASYNRLLQDLKSLGVKEGDVLVVHSSFKSLGEVEGGAECVIAAMKAAVGQEGTLLFPTFTFQSAYRTSYFSNDDTPSCVGFLSEYFRKTEGVIRTNHPTHSVAIYGKLQAEMNEGVELDDTPMGIHSPYRKLSKYGAKILMLGCTMAANSFMHAIDEVVDAPFALRWHQEYTVVDQNGNETKCRIRRHNFSRPSGINLKQRYDRTLEILEENVDYKIGTVHGAHAVLMDSALLEQKAVKKLKEDPLFFIDDPYGLYAYFK